MTDTASPSLSQQLGFAAKFIRLLEEAGLTPDDLKLAQQDPAIRRRLVQVFHPATERLMTDGGAAEQRRTVISDLIAPFGFHLNSEEQAGIFAYYGGASGFGSLYEKLGETSRSVLTLAYGLDGLTPLDAYGISYELETSVAEVNSVWRRTLATMRQELLRQLLKLSQDYPVGVLGFSTSLCSVLRSHGIDTVQNLTSRWMFVISLTVANGSWGQELRQARDKYELTFKQV